MCSPQTELHTEKRIAPFFTTQNPILFRAAVAYVFTNRKNCSKGYTSPIKEYHSFSILCGIIIVSRIFLFFNPLNASFLFFSAFLNKACKATARVATTNKPISNIVVAGKFPCQGKCHEVTKGLPSGYGRPAG